MNSKADQPRKILLVAETLCRGGAERQFVYLCEGLRNKGFDVRIALLYDDGPWGDYLREKGFPIHALGFRSPPLMGRKSIPPFVRFVRLMQDIRPDVAISFLYRASIWTALACRLAGVRAVISRRADCGFVRERASFPLLLERWAIRWTTLFVANSRAVGHYLTQEGVPLEKGCVIYNGTALPEIRTRLASKQPTIGILGNLSQIKDHITLVRAMSLVIAKHPNAVCEIAGIDSGCGKLVQEEAKRLGVAEKIRYLGAISDTDAFLAGIDVGVNCSKSEGLSNSILEYMAHGLPVVASNVGGNPELVVDGQTGYLFEVGNPELLARKILHLMDNPAFSRKMGREGRIRVEQNFALALSIERWCGIIRNTISHNER